MDYYGDLFRFEKCAVLNDTKVSCANLQYGEPFSIRCKGVSKTSINNLNIGIRIESRDGIPIIGPRSSDSKKYYQTTANESFEATAVFTNLQLVPGQYWVTVTALTQGNIIDQVSKAISFNVTPAIYSSAIIPHSGAWGFIQFNPIWKD